MATKVQNKVETIARIKLHDVVKLPFDEIGIVVGEPTDYPWANKCKVMIIRPTAFHEFGDIEDFLLNDLTFII